VTSRTLLLLIFALLQSPAFPIGTVVAQAAPRGFAAGADVVMRIYVPKGSVQIRTWTRDSVAINGTVGANASFFGGGDRRHIKFGVEPLRATDATLPTADFVVTVPRAARLWVKMIDGNLSVTGTTAELEAYAVRGQIVVRDVAGTTVVESIDAPITMTNVEGDLRVRGSKGAVCLENLSGTASIATISGSVHLTRSRAEARVETIGGDVQVSGNAMQGALLEIQTHAGAITLALDPARVPQLELRTRTGAISYAPPFTSRTTGQAANGRSSARSFKGAIRVGRDTTAASTAASTTAPKSR
jgi:DUF4097 and DUF4098 domain-containing protein YvlB